MPHMDGTETLRLIREIDKTIRVIVISGYASALLARELLQEGAYDFFQKTRGSDATSRGRRAAAHHARPGLIYFYYTDLEKWYNQA
jgi:DNA-binding NtrC family response regulator